MTREGRWNNYRTAWHAIHR